MENLQNLEAIENRLRDWAGKALKSEVSFRMPEKTQPAGDLINFYLFDLLNTPRPRTGSQRPATQVTLRYLATVTSPEPENERRLASELMFEAIDNTDLDIEPDPVPLPLWLALGLPPRPAFVFRIGLLRQTQEEHAPVVRKLEVRSAAIVGMNGRVIGPGDAPVMNAVVEMPTLRRSARTDSAGRFAFSTVPAEPQEVELVVRARGKEMSVRTSAHHSAEKLVVVKFDRLEE